MADEHAQRMFQLVTGYWGSQIVGAMARLGVPDCLANGSRDAKSIAATIGCDEQGMHRLLRGAVSIGVAKQSANGDFALTPLGQTLVTSSPASLRDMAAALTAPGHWLPWGRLDDAVKNNERQTKATLGHDIFEYFERHPEERRAFHGAMAGLSALEAEAIAAALETKPGEVVVDVGGGLGEILAALMQRNEKITGAILELESAVAPARAAIEQRGLSRRCAVIGGDFFKSVPPADVYVLKNILHDWDDPQAVTILANCARSLKPGGRLIIVEAILPKTGSQGIAPLLDLVMLVLTPGRERTPDEFETLLSQAGLRMAGVIDTHSLMKIIEARAAG